MNYSWGGRGRSCSACDSTIGFFGLKIVDPASPYFDGVTINRGDIIRILYNSEFDGFPNLGLNADEATGFPIVDPEYANDFYYFDLLGFDIAQMSWKPQPSRTLGRWIEFQHLPESGRVINLAATDWDGDGDFSSSDFILAFRSNAYEKASVVAATPAASLTVREIPGEYVAAAIMAQSNESKSNRRSALASESVDLAFQQDDQIKDSKPATFNAQSRPVSFFESIADLKAKTLSDSETSSDLQSLESSFWRRSETGI